MTVTIDLKPEVEARVVALAAAQGVSVGEYIKNFLEGLAATDGEPSYTSMPPEQWAREFEEWMDGLDYAGAPPLSDEAVSRESIYREREDSQR